MKLGKGRTVIKEKVGVSTEIRKGFQGGDPHKTKDPEPRNWGGSGDARKQETTDHLRLMIKRHFCKEVVGGGKRLLPGAGSFGGKNPQKSIESQGKRLLL